MEDLDDFETQQDLYNTELKDNWYEPTE